jgi:outer membrane protein OmpA-like peptidoglycan-associated protein
MSVASPSRPGLFWALVLLGVVCVLLLNLEFAPRYITADTEAADAGAPPKTSAAATSSESGKARIPASARVPTIVARFGNTSKEPLDDSAIKALATAMIEDHDTRIVLEGHSDMIGAEDYNHDLSLERANLVKARLVTLGVSEDRIETEGLGATHPLHSDIPDAGSVNRRVEVRWLGKAEHAPRRTRPAPPPPSPPAVVVPARKAAVRVADAGNTVGITVADAGAAPPPSDSDSGD